MSSSSSDLQPVKSSIVPVSPSRTSKYFQDHKVLIGFALFAVIFLSGVITAAFITSGQHTTLAFKAEVIAPAIGVPLVCAAITCIVAYFAGRKEKEPPFF